MKLRFTKTADKDYANLSPQVRRALAKQLELPRTNLQHPSLHAKKFDEANDIWQARINRSWRFYFVIRGDEYIVVSIIPDPK